MSQELKEFIEKESGLEVAACTEDKRYTALSFMRQKIILNGSTYVFRMTHLMNKKLDVYYLERKTNESKCDI